MGSFELLLVAAPSDAVAVRRHRRPYPRPATQAGDTFKPKAISLVLAGGVMAASSTHAVIVTKDMSVPRLFAATFVAQSGSRRKLAASS